MQTALNYNQAEKMVKDYLASRATSFLPLCRESGQLGIAQYWMTILLSNDETDLVSIRRQMRSIIEQELTKK